MTDQCYWETTIFGKIVAGDVVKDYNGISRIVDHIGHTYRLAHGVKLDL